MRFEVPMFPSRAVHFLAYLRSAGFAAAALPDPAPFRQIFAPSEDSEGLHCKRKGFAGGRSRFLFHLLSEGIASQQSVSAISCYASFVAFCDNRSAAFRMKTDWFLMRD
jgi:hypothetical protein